MTDASTSGGRAPRLLGGRYEVGALLGRGGMAEVHVARDARLGRVVAVKLLRSDLARDPSFQARFRREAQAAAGLNHPSIVAVYDTGADQVSEHGGAPVDLPWIVMEYVEGRTLRDMLRTDHPLSTTEALSITEGVLGALEYSHTKGIVHRDIKPANVMITPAGEVKVMDFGIARAISDSSATLTQTSAVMGTAQYLSPEQARGETVDVRSDLYSTGCLLYEILTGRPPFTGDAPVAVAYQHVSEQPKPPSVLAPAVPPAVDQVVLMALSKDREHRYQSAADFADDLRRAVEGRPLRGASFAPTGAPTSAVPTADPTTTLPAAGPPTAATRVTPAVPPGPPPGAAGSGGTGALPRTGQPDEDERKRRWPWVLLALVLLGGIGTAGYALLQQDGGGPGPSATSSPTAVDVPQVVGVPQEEAEDLLEQAQLEPAVVEEASDTVAEGDVISSDPAPGQSAAIGSTVTLTVSTGPAAVTVPDVTGFSQDDARAALRQAGLDPGSAQPTDEDPDAEPGTVVRTEPAADASVERNTPVTIYIASGQVEVPDLTGMTLEEAQAELNGRNLNVNARTDPEAEGEPGTVVSQTPSADATVDAGSSVEVVLAPEEAATPTPTASPTRTSTGTASPTSEATGNPSSAATRNSGRGNGNGNDGNGNGGNGNGGDDESEDTAAGAPTEEE
ncbi:Stk1 family PASTA domain-containing Ser/Thr kinase [Paenibacillus sp. TRM 82003]|uniref:Stk1 family PASTA domain-containing Ser/Thr kinase n=1 Tax=Kineococcus sp. TRM81007 TaxID=2925831 RepID=UPI001F56B380|nr:Stk1 family PASTA domain-containing Ser/Thr kinase [Kineococcus sp. TRM81007]MCI2237602.1 Stk1 family PASTA domain-containing Ser/Thr kinase [Kineococcus sp. TRM81007]MCI3921826.1 Stk1 family PASTA domain-containing Ser/Thr kinase [Paenibacillus sp. TRM 82003]